MSSLFKPSSTSSDPHLDEPNKISESPRINHHQHLCPTDYTEQAHRHRRMVTSSNQHWPRHKLRPGSAWPHCCLFEPMSVTPNYFNTSVDMEAATTPHRPAPLPRLDRGLGYFFINILWRLRRQQPTSFVTLARLEVLPRQANLCQHHRSIALLPIRQWVCGSIPYFGSRFSSECYNK